MNLEAALLDAIRETPNDPTPWLVLADWLEDQQDPRAELYRLTQALRLEREHPAFASRQARVQQLLAEGREPLMPRWTDPVYGIEFVLLPAGTFWEAVGEVVRHVTLTRAMYFGAFPITQAQWQAAMGQHISGFQGENNPVDSVTWNECERFCKKVGKRLKVPLRLPTGAEWEYACRAGTTTPFAFGGSASSHEANFNGAHPYNGGVSGPVRDGTTPVGSFRPNAWGLYDMHGNVWEWCLDWYVPHTAGPAVDPTGPETGTSRMLRGGCWTNPGHGCRSTSRNYCEPSTCNRAFGFRVCFTVA
jgi:uncharacterized protein (TIGR02996 family)